MIFNFWYEVRFVYNIFIFTILFIIHIYMIQSLLDKETQG